MIELLLIVVLIIHLLYYVVIFRKVAHVSTAESIDSKSNDISLVICFKNEADRVESLMKSVLHQAVSDIVLVDDFSIDETLNKLLQYQSERVQVIQPKIDKPGKKQAMQDGLATAKYDRVLVTDADCIPASQDWAAQMNSIDKPLVLGYGPMVVTDTFVNQFARFETYMTAIQYMGYALWGRPYMGVGRNMIIDKSIRNRNIDQIKGRDLASGDDDLTINAIATGDNIGVCLHLNSFVYSHSRQTWATFINQKKRHLTTSTHYKPIHQILLATFSGSHIAFYLLVMIGLIAGTIGPKIAFCTFVTKQLAQYWVHRSTSKKLHIRMSFVQFVMMDVVLFLYYSIMPFILLTSKNKNHWS